MGIEIGHYPDEERLDVTLEGSLDMAATREVLRACRLVDRHVRVCVIDATRIVRLFDSGIGLLMMLFDRLKANGVTPIVIGEIQGLPISLASQFDIRPLKQFPSVADAAPQ